MPYASIKDINPALKGLKPKITLAQANSIAKWADAMERAEDGPESPWAAAIAQFKKLYQVQGGKWVKRKVKESNMAYRGYFTSGSATVEINAIDVDGEAVPVAELVAAYEGQRDQSQTNIEREASEADVDRLRGLLQEALSLLEEKQEQVAEAQLSESASGHALALAEAQAVTGGPRAPLLMDVALITPGWGNKKDNHYYSPEVLRRDAKVFEGVKMYTTDHRPGEKSVRSEVSVVREITGFTDDGAPIAQVAVHDPDFAEATRNRKKLGTLETLECSILAAGRTKKGQAPDGRKGNIVEAITSAMSVDWVTKAGAGGHAIALAESAGGEQMAEEEQTTAQETEEESQEATLTEDGGEEEEITYLAESDVKEMLEASRLPPQAQERLAEGQYLDADALKAAVEQERAYIKELTGSGKPFAQGETAPPDAQMSEAGYDTAYADILRRHGVYVPQQEVA